MKRFITLSLIILTTTLLFAQKPSLTKAYNFYYEKDFEKAKEAIDLCTVDDKLKTKANTWLYKGNIYFYLANKEYSEKQQNSSYVVQYPNAPVEAYDAFIKARELNNNIEGYDMISPDDALAKLYTLLLICGVDQLIAKDYESAKMTLKKSMDSYEMKKPEYPLKGELYYYYAYTLEALNQLDSVAKYYEKAIQDGSSNSNVYVRLIEHYKKEKKQPKVLELIQSAQKILPEDPTILVAEVDYYYWINEKSKGKELLQKLPTTVYHNPDAIVNIANFYIKDTNYTKAEELLKKAERLNPDNFVIVYNLGVCYYFISEDLFTKANESELAGNKNEAFVLKTKSENYLAQAQTYFEEALKVEPNDLNMLHTLKSIYARNKSPKYDEIDKKIKSLE